MLNSDHETIWSDPLHITVQLKFVTDIQAGLAIENKLNGGCEIEEAFILSN